MLYPHVLSHIGTLLKRNFFVLPSSVHECILVPDLGHYTRFELMKMVREVNQNQVEEEEILSYQVYYYDPEERGSGDVAKWGIPLSFLRKLGSISQNYKEIHGETAGKFSKALQVRRFVV